MKLYYSMKVTIDDDSYFPFGYSEMHRNYRFYNDKSNDLLSVEKINLKLFLFSDICRSLS